MNYVVIANSMADIEILDSFAVIGSSDLSISLLNYFNKFPSQREFPLAVYLDPDDWSIGSVNLIKDYSKYQLVSMDVFKYPHLYPEYFI